MDTALAVSLETLEALTCKGCGHDRRESMDQSNEYAYTVQTPRCHACAAISRHQEALANDNMKTHGLAIITTHKDEVGGEHG